MLWLGMIGALALQASALPPGRTPTDVELKAGYCIKVLQSEQSGTEAALKTPSSDARITAALQAGYADTAERLARLRAYLVPRALTLEAVALTAALQRGEADAAAFTKGVEVMTSPGGAGIEPELLRRVQSCVKIDWLPF